MHSADTERAIFTIFIGQRTLCSFAGSFSLLVPALAHSTAAECLYALAQELLSCYQQNLASYLATLHCAHEIAGCSFYTVQKRVGHALYCCTCKIMLQASQGKLFCTARLLKILSS